MIDTRLTELVRPNTRTRTRLVGRPITRTQQQENNQEVDR